MIPFASVLSVLSLLSALTACDSISVERKNTPESDTGSDNDGDGYSSNTDCNDLDSSVHPQAPETQGDGVDSNCDGNDDT